MRITVMILAILGGLWAGMVGISWMDDAEKTTALLKKNESLLKRAGQTQKLNELKNRASQRGTASYLLFLTLLLGIVGGVFGFRRQGKIAAGALGVGLIVPAVVAPATLAVNALLILAFCMSFFVKPEEAKAAAA